MLQFLVKAGGRLAVLGLTAVLTAQAARAGGGLSLDIPDPCAGPGAMLDLLDRPTVGDSPCVVKPGQTVLETGVARYTLYGLSGYTWGYPQLELRWGLPWNNELVLLPPNISRVVMRAASGDKISSGGSASVLGIKHEFGYNNHWLWAGETLVTLPSGSPSLGSASTGYAVNGIVSYSVTPAFGLTLMLGGAHYAQPRTVQGGAYYWSLNPDFVAAWQTAPDFQLYAEVYGQNHTGPGQGSGYNVDGGIQYLVNPDFELDAELGRRLSGNLAGWSDYLGVGVGLLF